ncbi:hypothetical protein Trydic_g20435, partial [Trypoxylus dichotomus]
EPFVENHCNKYLSKARICVIHRQFQGTRSQIYDASVERREEEERLRLSIGWKPRPRYVLSRSKTRDTHHRGDARHRSPDEGTAVQGAQRKRYSSRSKYARS